MTNIFFTISDFTTNTLGVKVFMAPNISPYASGNYTITGNPQVQYGSGTVTFNNVSAGVYNVRVSSGQSNTDFNINVVETGGQTINGNTLIITQTANIPTSSFNIISASFSTTSLTSSYCTFFNLDKNSITLTNTASNFTVLSRNTGSYNSVFYNYSVVSSSNSRAGLMVGTFQNNTSSYVEYISQDTGLTSDLVLSLSLTQSSINLIAQSNTFTGWAVKSIGSYI
jgi:hypothetical protein